MDTTVAQDPTPTTTNIPAGEAAPPIVEAPDAPESIADHAEQFGPEPREPRPANTGQFAPPKPDDRRRAQSQRATPEDVAEINRLTKELRETEQRLADKDPDAKASPRVKTLKRQLAALKALEQPAPVPAAPKAVPPMPAADAPKAKAIGAEFSEKKPDIADFQAETDPLEAWMLAVQRWDRKRERFEEQQQQYTEQMKAEEQSVIDAANSAITSFKATKPDFDTVTAPLVSRHLPPILLNAIVRHDKRAEVMYHLGQQSDLVDELVLLTDGKTLSDASVAAVQRRLTASLSAVQAPDRPPATPRYTPPPPPNPVRTGPIKTADEPPGETASISEHTKYYGPKRRQ